MMALSQVLCALLPEASVLIFQPHQLFVPVKRLGKEESGYFRFRAWTLVAIQTLQWRHSWLLLPSSLQSGSVQVFRRTTLLHAAGFIER